MKAQLKKGNTVKVLAGDERGKTGEIIEIIQLTSKSGILNKRAIVKGLNIVKKHQKATKENKGGIVSIEKSIHLSNLQLVAGDKKPTEGKKEIAAKEIKTQTPKVKNENKKNEKKHPEKKDAKKVTKPTKKDKKSK
jgi:large subunit ribosomal protein L24